jgi:hypothetical protein
LQRWEDSRRWLISTREAQYDAVRTWGIPDHALLQRLSCLEMPVFVANGDSDPMILPHYSHLLAGLIPQAFRIRSSGWSSPLRIVIYAGPDDRGFFAADRASTEVAGFGLALVGLTPTDSRVIRAAKQLIRRAAGSPPDKSG